MSSLLIENASIVNEGQKFLGSLLIRNGLIEAIWKNTAAPQDLKQNVDRTIDATGLLLIPGVIDDQVHFREPGLTHKGNIYSEAKAAVAGGVTSFMEMPNTNPQTTTIEELDKKFEIANKTSLANFSFYLGATNNNIEEIVKIDPKKVCGVKVFMGSSTGNMLVDNIDALNKIFKHSPVLVATHCEDETTILASINSYKEKYGEGITFAMHPFIRSEEACYLSSSLAVKLAKQHGTRLHVLHISTKKELELFDNSLPLEQKRITGEVCVHHLWFSENDYEKLGWRIKWNPAIKTEADRLGLIDGLINGKLDVVATDHAPHTHEEKVKPYLQCPSGGPMVQHSLVAMLEMAKKGTFSIELVVDKMCHAPAKLFGVEKRGFIRESYFADLVLVDPKANWTVSKENIHYRCGWAPLEGNTFSSKVLFTIVNGNVVYDNGIFHEGIKGQALEFIRK
jgi:dihydroorotase